MAGLAGVCLHMMTLIIAPVSFPTIQQFLGSSVFRVKGREKEKTKMAKASQIFPGAFTVCLSPDRNDERDTRREKMGMFPFGVNKMKVLPWSSFPL